VDRTVLEVDVERKERLLRFERVDCAECMDRTEEEAVEATECEWESWGMPDSGGGRADAGEEV